MASDYVSGFSEAVGEIKGQRKGKSGWGRGRGCSVSVGMVNGRGQWRDGMESGGKEVW